MPDSQLFLRRSRMKRSSSDLKGKITLEEGMKRDS